MSDCAVKEVRDAGPVLRYIVRTPGCNMIWIHQPTPIHMTPFGTMINGSIMLIPTNGMTAHGDAVIQSYSAIRRRTTCLLVFSAK